MPKRKSTSVNVIGAVAGAIAIGVLAGACLPAGSGAENDQAKSAVARAQARTVASRNWVPPIGEEQNQGVGVAASGSPVPMAP